MEAKETFKYKFSGGGFKCPYCSSKTGWSYLRNYSKEFGQCFSCGIKRFPEWEQKSKLYAGDYNKKPTSEIKVISSEVVTQTLKLFALNPFIHFLKTVFGEDHSQKVLNQFFIGTAKHGGTVFWYIDKNLNARKPKVVFYSNDGKRIKDKRPTCGGYTNENGFVLCLFGEHQLHEKYYPINTPIIIVESEKTACVGYLALPQYIWLAIGGAKLNQERASVLLNRSIIILPDADEPGRHGSEYTSQILTNLQISNKVIDLFPDRNDKTDVADYIVSLFQRNQIEILKHPIPTIKPFPPEKVDMLKVLYDNYPLLWNMTERLNLVVKDLREM